MLVLLWQASARIMALLQGLAPQCPFEKASIDEAYVDITSLVVRLQAVCFKLLHPVFTTCSGLPTLQHRQAV